MGDVYTMYTTALVQVLTAPHLLNLSWLFVSSLRVNHVAELFMRVFHHPGTIQESFSSGRTGKRIGATLPSDSSPLSRAFICPQTCGGAAVGSIIDTGECERAVISVNRLKTIQ